MVSNPSPSAIFTTYSKVRTRKYFRAFAAGIFISCHWLVAVNCHHRSQLFRSRDCSTMNRRADSWRTARRNGFCFSANSGVPDHWRVTFSTTWHASPMPNVSPESTCTRSVISNHLAKPACHSLNCTSAGWLQFSSAKQRQLKLNKPRGLIREFCPHFSYFGNT